MFPFNFSIKMSAGENDEFQENPNRYRKPLVPDAALCKLVSAPPCAFPAFLAFGFTSDQNSLFSQPTGSGHLFYCAGRTKPNNQFLAYYYRQYPHTNDHTISYPYPASLANGNSHPNSNTGIDYFIRCAP